MVRLAAVTAALALLSLPGAASAAAPSSCPGREISADRVITGGFGSELQGSYVMVPFEVPAGTTAVRVKYCHDQPEAPTSSTPGVSIRHTLDLGLYEPRRRGPVWGTDEFRGWGGSSHPDVTVSPEGFSTEAEYLASANASPRGSKDPPGKTTRAFRPGPIRPGLWAVELGVAAVASRDEGDADGRVEWRVEVELARDPAFADQPYRPATYDPSPARRGPGWYAGDMHVHAEHSNYGAATMSETFDYAFRSSAGPGLDFLMLTDYVSGGAWGEIGHYQPSYPGKLIARSAEVITYRGHMNSHNNARAMDYRTGPLFERRGDGSLASLRGARPAREVLREIHAAGGFAQINHPTIFPSSVPGFANFCRGCSWEYSPEETDYSQVDGIEVATGPSGLKTEPRFGPNPFTLTAIDFYEAALGAGARIAAIGVSDSHDAGRTPSEGGLGITQSPIGEATTVVYAEELSEPAVECAVEAGHTYAKVTGNDGPDLRFEAGAPGWRGKAAIMGDVVQAGQAHFAARVLRGSGRDLLVYRNGSLVARVSVGSDDFTHRFSDTTPGRYRLQLLRAQTIETVSSPIYLQPGPGVVQSRDCTPLSVRGSAASPIPIRRGAFPARCRAYGGGLRSCTVRAYVNVRRRGKRTRPRTIGSGRVSMRGGSRRVRVQLNRAGLRLVRRHRKRGRAVRLVFVASDEDGDEARHRWRTKLVRAKKKRRARRR